MRVRVTPDTLLERLGMWVGKVPVPLIDTFNSLLIARTVMAATRCGVFEALADGPRTPEEVARYCDTAPLPTAKLLDALLSLDYLAIRGDRYELGGMARRFLLRNSPKSVVDFILWRYMEWEGMASYEDHLRTGSRADFERILDAGVNGSDGNGWDMYIRGMRSLNGLIADEVAARIPVPAGATDILDIGGSHGFQSVVLCRRHPRLRAVVLDLPKVVRRAGAVLAQEGMGDRVTLREGDALTDDLGAAAFDLIVMCNMIHNFDREQNRQLVGKASVALRPGGVMAIVDLERPEPGRSGQTAALTNLYFSMINTSGTWTPSEVSGWQRDAGLEPCRPMALRRGPGIFIQNALKPAAPDAP